MGSNQLVCYIQVLMGYISHLFLMQLSKLDEHVINFEQLIFLTPKGWTHDHWFQASLPITQFATILQLDMNEKFYIYF